MTLDTKANNRIKRLEKAFNLVTQNKVTITGENTAIVESETDKAKIYQVIFGESTVSCMLDSEPCYDWMYNLKYADKCKHILASEIKAGLIVGVIPKQ